MVDRKPIIRKVSESEKAAKKMSKPIRAQYIVSFETNKYSKPQERGVYGFTKEEAETKLKQRLDKEKAAGEIEWYKIISFKADEKKKT